jgi:YVTN family beta-propeller protein
MVAQLYVASQSAGTVTPIRTKTNTALTPIKVGRGPIGMVFGP